MSLFLKIFLSFGVAMAATLVATVYISFQFAQGAFDPVRIEQHDPMVNEAAIALADRGEAGSAQLAGGKHPTGIRVDTPDRR